MDARVTPFRNGKCEASKLLLGALKLKMKGTKVVRRGGGTGRGAAADLAWEIRG